MSSNSGGTNYWGDNDDDDDDFDESSTNFIKKDCVLCAQVDYERCIVDCSLST
jgi:hypothetical protein